MRKKIVDAYVRHILSKGAPPVSIFHFMYEMGESEAEFYTHFASFHAVESSIWEEFIQDTLGKVKNEEVYADYMVREKVLSFYYTLLEELKQQRSFVVYSFRKRPRNGKWSSASCMKSFKEHFQEFIKEVLFEGEQSGELAERPFIQDRYKDLFWLQLLFILDYWTKDHSEQFESTDTLVEKAVNLAFDLMGTNILDASVDFVKFMIQHRP
ncbi:TetR family transcriptional regulator C-terminal domain-containing protein [Algivirga pacifica]|uniref:Tetracyclin repressor-like C-terminal domain-containing protein n=1 Tax=Algivirga pacifica TaxID=1162670 RepID=A0ABP9D0Y3_9BACT